RFTYDFQRGLSSYSRCPITGKLKLMHFCASGCDAGWKGYDCRERDCTVRNGDCGAEMKCVESLVNNTMYTECACPTGTVRNNFNLCEVFRENLALHKPAFLSSVNGANEAKYLTDGIYYDFKFAQINDKKSNWMAVDLQMSYCIGYVIVYNRFSETDSIMHQLDNFVVRLNGTFDTSADYDIRKKVNLCGRWPSEALNGVNQMKVVCENFTLISKFVIVQEADKNFIGSMGVVELEVYSVGTLPVTSSIPKPKKMNLLSTDYVGCYQFIEAVKTKDVGSISECSSFCKEETTRYISLKGGKECNCNDRLGLAVPSSYCNTSCSNNDACGGKIYYSIYDDRYAEAIKMPRPIYTFDAYQKCIFLCMELNYPLFWVKLLL
ncbi:hypothetical protein HELRODRAFT_184495, partial [Helobdella robusta]|uniref:WSC domain-containing protein n=1 Tax=Helobdella robusta TaxID=6412 RepID=T1FLB6_HELRO